MGPWEEAEKGVIYKQEVLWDNVRVEGVPQGDTAASSRPDANASG